MLVDDEQPKTQIPCNIIKGVFIFSKFKCTKKQTNKQTET